MTNQKQHLQTIIQKKQRRLQSLQEKKARLGNTADVSLDHEIEDLEAELPDLREQLAALSGSDPQTFSQLSARDRQYQFAIK